MSYIELYNAPFDAALQSEYAEFLRSRSLRDEQDADVLALMRDESESITACGSLSGKMLKQIATAETLDGEGRCAAVCTALVSEAAMRGITHLFLCTKPESARLFGSMGFYKLASTDGAVLMENRRSGLSDFLDGLPRHSGGVVSAVVMNCNPFTLGHRYLVERAASESAWLYLFVVSEPASEFSPEERFRLVKEGTKDIENITVCESGDYLVSRATFPAYFVKEERVALVRDDLDIALFAQRIAPALNIARRYMGTEPFSDVTRAYNERMKIILPQYGIQAVEIDRKDGISASLVRAYMKNNDLASIRPLVPDATYEAVVRRLGADAGVESNPR